MPEPGKKFRDLSRRGKASFVALYSGFIVVLVCSAWVRGYASFYGILVGGAILLVGWYGAYQELGRGE